jgi:hypothetical protein
VDAAWLAVVILVPVVAAGGAIALIAASVRRQFVRHGRRADRGE